MKHFLTLLLLISLVLPNLPVSAQDDEVYAVVVPDILYLRTTPTTVSTKVADLPTGTQVLLIGIEINPNDDGQWVFVAPVNTPYTGWVRSDYLRFPDDFNRLSQLPVVGERGSGGDTSTQQTIVGVPAITTEFANLREGPELTYNIIRQLPPNTELTLIKRTTNNVWLEAVVNGNPAETGWVFYQLIDALGDINSLPTPQSANTTTVFSESSNDTSSTTAPTAPNPPTVSGQPSVSSNPPMALGVVPGTEGGSDGRLNAYDDLGYALVYCVDGNNYTNAGTFAGGGVAVYHWNDGSMPLFASEGQIKGTPNGQMVIQQGTYALYIREEGGFLLTGVDQSNTNYTFIWDGCNYGKRVQ